MEQKTTSRWFTVISWGITIIVVLALGAFAFWRMQNPPEAVAAAAPESDPVQEKPAASIAVVQSTGPAVSLLSLPAIGRQLTLKTNIPERPRYAVITRTVQRGDSLYALSKEFSLEPETLLLSNYDVLEDDAHSLKPGQELLVPPTDGLLHKWEDGDTLEKVAGEYQAKPEDIINWMGNNLDLTNPQPKIGQLVMVPGGWRESKAPVVDLGSSSSGSCSVASGGFGWPAGEHYLSGNDYFPGHYGIDIAASEGAPIYAAASGLVIKAASGWNSGYGNYIVIDHCNGYTTLYAHLSVINVSAGTVVGQGAVIGASGNTGNSFGAHLHFETRLNGAYVNPWSVFQ